MTYDPEQYEDAVPQPPPPVVVPPPDFTELPDPYVEDDEPLAPIERHDLVAQAADAQDYDPGHDIPGEIDRYGYPVGTPDPINAHEIHGGLNAICARVVKTYYDSSHPSTGHKQTIDVEMVDVTWDATTNLPTLTPRPQTGCEPTPTVMPADPFPLRYDQPCFHVEADDDVVVYINDDGKAFYAQDELPFIGTVIEWQPRGEQANPSAAEDFVGGAGTKAISVQRNRFLPGADPDDVGFDWTFGTTLGVLSVYYERVWVITAATQHHGYRTGDKIWVMRRGRYFVALPQQQTFFAEITDGGPASAANHTDSRYWAQEVAPDITYAAEADDYTINSLENQDRWVCAFNASEYAAGTHLLSPGDLVLVHMFADPADGEPVYIFDKTPITGASIADAFCVNATYSPQYPAGNDDWTAITATDITAATPTTGKFYGKGEMYEDGNGKLNPSFTIDPSAFFKYGDDNPYDVADPPDGEDATGDPTEVTHKIVEGWMAPDVDGDGEMRPWIAIDPNKILNWLLLDYWFDISADIVATVLNNDHDFGERLLMIGAWYNAGPPAEGGSWSIHTPGGGDEVEAPAGTAFDTPGAGATAYGPNTFYQAGPIGANTDDIVYVLHGASEFYLNIGTAATSHPLTYRVENYDGTRFGVRVMIIGSPRKTTANIVIS